MGLKSFLEEWKQYKEIRSHIEDLFKVGKGAFGWGLVHRDTEWFAARYVAVGVLLVGLVIQLGFEEKEAPQRFSEW